MTSIKSFLLKNKYLRDEYNFYLSQNVSVSWNRYIVFVFLFVWHCIFRIQKRVFNIPGYKKIKTQENGLAQREDIDFFVSKLEKYDVVSFDVFDTLVLRPFENPTDCFTLLGNKNKLFWFPKYRKAAECTARKKTKKPNKEIDIFDIYTELVNYYNIPDVKIAAEEEIALEKSICYANPYMAEVCKRLSTMRKKTIAVSDMYLPEQYIRQILVNCGYEHISEIFVSCDYGVSKITGELQKIIQNKIGLDKKIIHIDDNGYCINGCKKAGWGAIHYKRCARFGYPFRIHNAHTPVSQMYKGIINNYLHCGVNKLNPQEEIGFVYAGIAVCGYDEWLTRLCQINGYDKILFLARDMDVFYEAYIHYYNDIKSEYVQSSRSSLRQFYFEQCPEEFFRFAIDLRSDLGKTIGEVLDEVDLSFLKKYADKEQVELSGIFTKEKRLLLRGFILNHKKEVIANYDEYCDKVKEYFIEKIGTAKKICIAGLGWAGTEIVFLKWLIETKWKLPVAVSGTLFGAGKAINLTDNVIANGISVFAFGEMINRNVSFEFLKNDYAARLAIEHIFTSPECSLVKYITDNSGDLQFVRKKNNPNAELIRNIHRGIFLFFEEFMRFRKPYISALPISGLDAYEPLFQILNNKKYISLALGDFVEKPQAISGFGDDKDYIKLRDIL